MRNPITQWGDHHKIKGFGTTENAFNQKMVEQLNVMGGVNVSKIGGGMYNSNKPDIMGLGWGKFVALENKFIKGFMKKRDDTVVFDRTAYSPGQLEFFQKLNWAAAEYLDEGTPILGSLIGVLSSYRIIIGMSYEVFSSEGTWLTAGCLREIVAEAEKKRCPFVEMSFDLEPEYHANLRSMVRSLECHS